MGRLPVEVERKLGMIKAYGIDVGIRYVDFSLCWEVRIGGSTKDIDDDEALVEYVDMKLKEVRNVI